MTSAPSPVVQAIRDILTVKKLPDEQRHPALVMYSGGLDSFAVLYALLSATNLSVHAHHVEIVNFEGRAQAETEAIAAQRAWLAEHCRPFEYSTSRHEFRADRTSGTDTQVTMFTAGRVYNWLEGRLWTIWTGHIRPPEWEMTEGAALLHSMFINRAMRPYWVRPLKRLDKPQILGSVPPETVEMLWSCRTPVNTGSLVQPCGSCRTCLERAEASRLLHDQG